VLQIFLTKDEVQRSEEEEENISSLLHFFSVLLLFLKLAKLSKKNK
jgi:hypothetical protein